MQATLATLGTTDHYMDGATLPDRVRFTRPTYFAPAAWRQPAKVQTGWYSAAFEAFCALPEDTHGRTVKAGATLSLAHKSVWAKSGDTFSDPPEACEIVVELVRIGTLDVTDVAGERPGAVVGRTALPTDRRDVTITLGEFTPEDGDALRVGLRFGNDALAPTQPGTYLFWADPQRIGLTYELDDADSGKAAQIAAIRQQIAALLDLLATLEAA